MLDKYGRLWVSNSLLSDMATCSTKAHLTWQQQLTTPKNEAPLFAGNVVHEVLAKHFSGESVEECIAHFLKAYYKFGTDEVPVGDRFSYVNVKTILLRWLQTHPTHTYPFTILPEFNERTFAAEIRPNIVLYGTIDMLGEHKMDGNLSLIDNKTTGNIASWWKKSYWQRSQLYCYAWLVERVLGRKVHASYINAIELSKLPDSARKCKIHGTPHAECASHHAKWETYGPITYDGDSMREWELTTIHLAKKYLDLVAQYPLPSDLSKVRSQGMFNGGCTFCQYNEFCRANRPLKAISMLFKHSTRQYTQVRDCLTMPGMRPYLAPGEEEPSELVGDDAVEYPTEEPERNQRED